MAAESVPRLSSRTSRMRVSEALRLRVEPRVWLTSSRSESWRTSAVGTGFSVLAGGRRPIMTEVSPGGGTRDKCVGLGQPASGGGDGARSRDGLEERVGDHVVAGVVGVDAIRVVREERGQVPPGLEGRVEVGQEGPFRLVQALYQGVHRIDPLLASVVHRPAPCTAVC